MRANDLIKRASSKPNDPLTPEQWAEIRKILDHNRTCSRHHRVKMEDVISELGLKITPQTLRVWILRRGAK